jgi:hypothetical protein
MDTPKRPQYWGLTPMDLRLISKMRISIGTPHLAIRTQHLSSYQTSGLCNHNWTVSTTSEYSQFDRSPGLSIWWTVLILFYQVKSNRAGFVLCHRTIHPTIHPRADFSNWIPRKHPCLCSEPRTAPRRRVSTVLARLAWLVCGPCGVPASTRSI